MNLKEYLPAPPPSFLPRASLASTPYADVDANFAGSGTDAVD